MAKLQSLFSSKKNLCVLLKELWTKKVLYQCCKHCPFFSDLHSVTVWLRKKKTLAEIITCQESLTLCQSL